MIHEALRNRKGARKSQDIPLEVMKLLNQGKIPTVNLTEWLAIDHVKLINNTFPKIGLANCRGTITKAIHQQKKPSAMSTIKIIGLHLFEHCLKSDSRSTTIELLTAHESDTIRCFATYLIALDNDWSILEKLRKSRKLIADKHFGVREIAWMALRPEIEKNLTKSIDCLSNWATEADENIRRFSIESIRPRGVWCKHIGKLKEEPHLALPILEKLKSDHSKYVQLSVGNWLNDASKSKPKFVIEICKKWKSESPTTETKKIIKRAMRTIEQ